MFSPYYAWSRRRGTPDPENHAALNVAIYGERGNRWTMTERGRASVQRSADTLTIGPSAVHWDGTKLTISIDEVTVPIPGRVRGEVRLYPHAMVGQPFVLDADGQHHWHPLAPSAHIEVDLQRPDVRWSGDGYFDTNAGANSLESTFTEWDWSRAPLRDGTAVLYDVTGRDGHALSLAVRIDPSGGVHRFTPPPKVPLPKAFWRVPRATQVEEGHQPTVLRTLEDAPFYARSVVSSHLLGEPVVAMHESLSLDRFSLPVVQMMLPFRMPRTLR